MPRSVDHKRERFYATQNEQRLINWMREFAWNSVISENVTKSIFREWENLERKKDYLKDHEQMNTQEFEDLAVSIGLFEVFYYRWKAYMDELKVR